ncbi:hypothetical protein HDV06_005387 [Boothiomyces sp. JEL0866]|nr:hypothetical protein HDV06_005387 [Boothiomyces sp. JEL0866]
MVQCNGPMVVLLSGAQMSGSYLVPLQRKLQDLDVSSVTFDKLGTGKSDSTEEMSFKLYAQHIHELIKIIPNEKIILVGHSFGVQFYTQLYEIDSRIKSIILVEPTPTDLVVKENPKGFDTYYSKTDKLQNRIICTLADLGLIRLLTDLITIPFKLYSKFTFAETSRFLGDFSDSILINKLSVEVDSIMDMFYEGKALENWKPIPTKTIMVVGGSGQDGIVGALMGEFYKQTSARLDAELLLEPSKSHFTIIFSKLLKRTVNYSYKGGTCIGAYVALHHLRAYIYRKPKNTVLVDGKKVSYEKTNHGEPIVILVPGATMSSSWLIPIQYKLSSNSISSLIFDRLGSGKSDAINKPTLKSMASQIDAIIKSVENKSIVLVGHSFGGLAAVLLAEPTPVEYLYNNEEFQKEMKTMLDTREIKTAAVLGDLGVTRLMSDLQYSRDYFKMAEVGEQEKSNRLLSENADGHILRKLALEFECMMDMNDEGFRYISNWKSVPIPMDMVVGNCETGLLPVDELKGYFVQTAERLNGKLYSDDSLDHFSILYSDLLHDLVVEKCQ